MQGLTYFITVHYALTKGGVTLHPRKDFAIYGKSLAVTVIERVGNVYIAERSGKPAYLVGFPPKLVGTFAATPCAVIDRRGAEIPVMVPHNEYGRSCCYECNLIHELGDMLQNDDILYPKFEKTCGAVMFTEKDESETADREVFEETGLRFEQFGEFREEYTYTTKQNTIKTGVFFIGHYDFREPKIQEDEIVDDWLLSYVDAMRLLNFPEDKDLLGKAEKYISEYKKQ